MKSEHWIRTFDKQRKIVMNTSMLVGYTGFVGSNIVAKYDFTWKINSKNIEEAFGQEPDLLVYAGLRAEKFLANKDPEMDMASVMEAYEQIKKIRPKKLVLISTVDVYKDPVGVDEDTVIDTEGLLPYGANRYKLEQMVRETWEDALIIRLPGLFGKNLKKNFIYDYIHVIPAMLREEKYRELSNRSSLVEESYRKLDNGFYKCILLEREIRDAKDIFAREELKLEFGSLDFSALNFTDSRGVFQFYNLANLWDDICTALEKDIRLLNIATEPVSVAEVYTALCDKEFDNEIMPEPPFYDYRSKHAEVFGGRNGYFTGKIEILKQICEFVKNY